MNDVDKLIAEIEERAVYTTEEGDKVLYENLVIGLIRKHLAGKVIVPVEPTDEMLEAGVRINNENCGYTLYAFTMAEFYKAMITIGEQE